MYASVLMPQAVQWLVMPVKELETRTTDDACSPKQHWKPVLLCTQQNDFRQLEMMGVDGKLARCACASRFLVRCSLKSCEANSQL